MTAKPSTICRSLCSRFVAASFAASLLAGATITRADWVYTDVIDGVYHPLHSTPNTFNANTDSATDWSNSQADGDSLPTWRFRDTSGPGPNSWNASVFTGFYSTSDPPLYMLISGLQPHQQYFVRVYGLFPADANARHGAEFSTDSGLSWTLVDRTIRDSTLSFRPPSRLTQAESDGSMCGFLSLLQAERNRIASISMAMRCRSPLFPWGRGSPT